MLSHDLLQARAGLSGRGRVLDRGRFFRQSRRLLGHILAGSGDASRESQPYSSRLRQESVRQYVRLYRAAIALLACREDFDTVEYLITAYNVHSQQVLEAGKGLAIEELNILQVTKDSRDELDREIAAIRKVQKNMTTEVHLEVIRFKYGKAALFQGLEEIAKFYRGRYRRWPVRRNSTRESDERKQYSRRYPI